MCYEVHIYLFYFHFDSCKEWLVRKVLPYRNKCCALDPCSRSPLQSRLKLHSPLLLFFPALFLNNFHDNADSKAQKQQQMTKRANKTSFCGKSPWSNQTDKRESYELLMQTPDEFCSKFDINNNTTARRTRCSSNFTAIYSHICAEWTREHQPADREE